MEITRPKGVKQSKVHLDAKYYQCLSYSFGKHFKAVEQSIKKLIVYFNNNAIDNEIWYLRIAHNKDVKLTTVSFFNIHTETIAFTFRDLKVYQPRGTEISFKFQKGDKIKVKKILVRYMGLIVSLYESAKSESDSEKTFE